MWAAVAESPFAAFGQNKFHPVIVMAYDAASHGKCPKKSNLEMGFAPSALINITLRLVVAAK